MRVASAVAMILMPLTVTVSNMTAHAEVTQQHTVRGYVFKDLDHSRTYKSNDPGFPGVIVKLLRNDKPVAQTITDQNGMYEFLRLKKGSYVVSIDSTDPMIPHDFSITGLRIVPFSIQEDTEETLIDFSLIRLSLPQGSRISGGIPYCQKGTPNDYIIARIRDSRVSYDLPRGKIDFYPNGLPTPAASHLILCFQFLRFEAGEHMA